MMPRLAFIALLAGLAAACSQEQPAPEGDAATPAMREVQDPALSAIASRQTSLADCPLLRSAPDEAGFYEYECEGPGGYRLRLVEADLRENIVVLPPDGGEHNLNLPEIANGAFTSVGDMVEWRGEAERGTFRPQALVLHQLVTEDPDPAAPEVSYVLAVRLADTPCVVARIEPGKDQERLAREAADGDGGCMPKAE